MLPRLPYEKFFCNQTGNRGWGNVEGQGKCECECECKCECKFECECECVNVNVKVNVNVVKYTLPRPKHMPILP